MTLFGQSAGAAIVIDLMAAPRARGLFARAIAQSFGVTPMRTLAAAEFAGRAFAAGVGAGDIAALRALARRDLLARYLEQSERWMPIVDGALIERPVIETFDAGASRRVPLLTGWNRDEGTAFPGADDAAAFASRLARRFGARADDAERSTLGRTTPRRARRATRWSATSLFAWGVWRAARDHARIAPTWVYHFEHLQPFAPTQRYGEADPASALGVFHSSEYPYVFGTTAVLSREWGEADRRMTGLMQAVWLRFAKTGRPDGIGELAAWPTFDDAAATVLRLASTPALTGVPRRAQLCLLDGGPRDQRQDHAHRAPRLPDRGVQGADDLQPLVRQERHRRRRRADGRAGRGLPRRSCGRCSA